MKKLLMVFASVMSAMAASAETIAVTQANIANYRTLQGGNTYCFVEDIDFIAPSTESAMKVVDGANVSIEILANVTVQLTGGAASGQAGAGAGIEVPQGATLVIGGDGTLNAVGEIDANGPRGAVGAPAGAKNVVERYPDGVGTK